MYDAPVINNSHSVGTIGLSAKYKVEKIFVERRQQVKSFPLNSPTLKNWSALMFIIFAFMTHVYIDNPNFIW